MTPPMSTWQELIWLINCELIRKNTDELTHVFLLISLLLILKYYIVCFGIKTRWSILLCFFHNIMLYS